MGKVAGFGGVYFFLYCLPIGFGVEVYLTLVCFSLGEFEVYVCERDVVVTKARNYGRFLD